MTKKEAEKIARHALPKIFKALPQHMKVELLKQDDGSGRSMYDELVGTLAREILWKASDIEAKKAEQYV